MKIVIYKDGSVAQVRAFSECDINESDNDSIILLEVTDGLVMRYQQGTWTVVPDADVPPMLNPSPRLTWLEATPEQTQMRFEGGACAVLADSFIQQFKGSGAMNYLELVFASPSEGSFAVTIQKASGITPAGKVAKMKALILEGKIDEALGV